MWDKLDKPACKTVSLEGIPDTTDFLGGGVILMFNLYLGQLIPTELLCFKRVASSPKQLTSFCPCVPPGFSLTSPWIKPSVPFGARFAGTGVGAGWWPKQSLLGVLLGWVYPSTSHSQ